ncbi:MAG TPA: radical SAM family heme chaperone HemW [Rhizomicrobium sp.]|jgi:oxygen-independent coproporphyrinogen-3 oxidase|nr:radical SAM family heme chaperone HemW [Rhizomicrobium sp.]
MSFGIYVHWPFCAAKCPYCDFNSHVRTAIDEDGWVDAIARELDWTAEAQGKDRPIVETIFFGGGTPSLMQGRSAARILDKISRLWRMANDVEITLEANPASADAARFADYRAAGVNRLSLGMQALNDADLKFLGRLHNAAEARAALDLAMAHFQRVSLDLIYARPGQSDAQWREELKQALAFGTDHLSLYQLTIEPETPFALLHRNGQLRIPDDDLAAGLYETTQELTEAAGLPAYEISNHARPGSESRHNLIYWRYGDYAGVGPGAHGRLMLNGKRIATSTIRLPERWRETVAKENKAFADFTGIDDADAAREHLLMNLRLREGIDLAAYEARWGHRPSREKIMPLIEQGMLRKDGDMLSATPRGRLVLNAVISELLN